MKKALCQAGYYAAAMILVAVILLSFGYNFGEALFVGNFRELVVHVGPLVLLAICGIVQIRDRIGHAAIMEELEPDLGVFLFI